MPGARKGSAPSISAIIPTYNRAEYLREALCSVIGQTLAPDEIIVVDDGSTDDTVQVLSEFGAKVRYARQEHRGVSAARNRGLQLATSDLIAWLDADDLWEPEFLSSVVPFLSTHPELDGVYCGHTHIDAGGDGLPTPVLRVVTPEDLYSALVESDFIVTPAIVAYRRCYDRAGPFDLDFQMCEDYDMWLRLAKNFAIAGVPQPLVRIRVHSGSTIMSDRRTLCGYRLALTQKHFGTCEGNPDDWSTDKRRAYGFAFLTCALMHLESGASDEGWRYMTKATRTWPLLLTSLDVLYELACGDQVRGYRGRADLMDIDANARELFERLDALFDTAGPAVRATHRKAYGNAYLALAMLSDQAGRWSNARGYLFHAMATNLRLVTSPSVARRFVKVCSGHSLVRFAKAVRTDRVDGHRQARA